MKKLFYFLAITLLSLNSINAGTYVGADDVSMSGTIAYLIELEQYVDIDSAAQSGYDSEDTLESLDGDTVIDELGTFILQGDVNDEFITNSIDIDLQLNYNLASKISFCTIDETTSSASGSFELVKTGGSETSTISLTLTMDTPQETPGKAAGDCSDPSFSDGVVTLPDGAGVHDKGIFLDLAIDGGQKIFDFESGVYTEFIYVKSEQDE